MSFNLDINDLMKGDDENNPQRPGKEFLADMDPHRIARVFSGFSREKRVLVIPIGFPQAGKSLLLSSLMYYAIKGEDTLFRAPLEDKFPFDKGRRTADSMKRYFETGKIYEATSKGTLDLIGIRMEPSRAGLPKLNLAFLDLAGEDVKKIKTSEGAAFTEKIDAVFNGLKIDDSPVIFVLITPCVPAMNGGETIGEAHDREDTLHYDFLNHVLQHQPHLKRNAKFFVIVSQWDKNEDRKQDVEYFMRTCRPAVYNYIKNMDVIWGEYSIGQLLETKVNDVNVQEIVRINFDYPARFWTKLYEICTRKSLQGRSFFAKLLSYKA